MQSKAEIIFLEIKKRAEAINIKLAKIEVYNTGLKDSDIYDTLINEIEAFNNYIKEDAFLEMGIPPEDMYETKKQVYESLFSSEHIHPVELLCCAQKLDYDELLVCARRAKYLDVKSFLFICNINFLKDELWDKGIKIDNVTNLGILHHYNADLTFDLTAANKAINLKGGDEASQYAVEKVFDIIPNFVKDNIRSPSLKVVLRSCSGAEIPGKDALKPHLETIAYPIRLLTPSLDISPALLPNQNKAAAKEKTPNRATDKASTSEAPESKPKTRENKRAAEVSKPAIQENELTTQGVKPETQENKRAAQVSKLAVQENKLTTQGIKPEAQENKRAAQANRTAVRVEKKANKKPEKPPKTAAEIEKINKYREAQLKEAKKINKLNKLDNTITEKGTICISQDKVGDELITMLYLPFEGTDPIPLQGFPELTTAANFKQFADMLIEHLVKEQGPLHVNPYDIGLIIPSKNYAGNANKMHENGFKQFKASFSSPYSRARPKDDAPKVEVGNLPLLSQWHSTEELPRDKKHYKKLLTTANDFKDVFPLPENTYSKRLLDTIKDTCPNVTLFKCYYGGYNAAPNRMVHQAKDASDANHPKGLIVSRAAFWGEKKPEAPETPDASPENKQNPTGSF